MFQSPWKTKAAITAPTLRGRVEGEESHKDCAFHINIPVGRMHNRDSQSHPKHGPALSHCLFPLTSHHSPFPWPAQKLPDACLSSWPTSYDAFSSEESRRSFTRSDMPVQHSHLKSVSLPLAFILNVAHWALYSDPILPPNFISQISASPRSPQSRCSGLCSTPCAYWFQNLRGQTTPHEWSALLFFYSLFTLSFGQDTDSVSLPQGGLPWFPILKWPPLSFLLCLPFFPHITYLGRLYAPREQGSSVFHCFITNTHVSKYVLNKYFWKNDWAGISREDTRALAFEVVRKDLRKRV